MKKWQSAFVGCGSISEKHLQGVANIDNVNIHTVCDLDMKRGLDKARAYNCNYYGHFQEVLEDKSIDVIHILTPHYLHTDMTVRAVESGKKVVLEKPMGISKEELAILREKSIGHVKDVGVIFQNRYNKTVKKMIEVIGLGRLGMLVSVRAQLAWSREGEYYSQSNWRGNKALSGGGLLINQAIHTLDLMQLLARTAGLSLHSLKGIVTNMNHLDIEVEDTAMATLFFEQGVLGNFYGTNCNGNNSPIEMELIFEKGKLILQNQSLYELSANGYERIAEDIVETSEKGYWGIGHRDCIEGIYQSFDRSEKPPISIEEAMMANEIVLNIYDSKGNVIDLRVER